MNVPDRVTQQTGRYAKVDGIPFQLPISCQPSPVILAAFSVDANAAATLLPGNELFPMRLLDKGLLVVTVVNYRGTNIGNYIEFSIAIACTHGTEPAPPLLSAILRGHYQTGQFVFDLPVSTEISVKGGKGIWGMPKHQASLSFEESSEAITAQYEADGILGMALRVARPNEPSIPLSLSIASYAHFRGLLCKAYLYFEGNANVTLNKEKAAQLVLGNHPRMAPLQKLGINPDPIFTAYLPEARGILDDHFECWFVTSNSAVPQADEGLSSVVGLGLGQQWPPPPAIKVDFGL
jgi:hypothetical protein